MLKVKHKARIIRLLENAKGDDLYRARLAFRGLSPEEMKKEYGKSGQSCQEILDEYEAHEAEINETIAWVRGL